MEWHSNADSAAVNTPAKKDTATAIGTFTGLQSICTMLASSMAGLLWFKYGASVALSVTAIMTIFVIIYFLWIGRTRTN